MNYFWGENDSAQEEYDEEIENSEYSYEYDEEENGTIKCYSPAVTSDYAMLNEPWGFWFFGAEELGQLYNDSSENDCKIMARDIIQLDKDYRFDKNDEEKILELVTRKPIYPSESEINENPPSRSAKSASIW